jgi:hypothetical protein
MRSAKEILEYIDTFYRRALARPSMFASTPQSLEEKLSTLERLRQFILSDGQTPDPATDPYSDFLLAKGYGVSQFTTSYYPHHTLSDHDQMVFHDFCEFWKSFIDHRKKND